MQYVVPRSRWFLWSLCTLATIGHDGASAQGVAGPFLMSVQEPHAAFSSATVPAGILGNLRITRYPGARNYMCAITCNVLSPAYGGAGGVDLLCGDYDPVTDAFTSDTTASGLNTGELDGFMSIHRSGLWAVFDRYRSTPRVATRAAVGLPWRDLGPIQGLPGPIQGWYASSLGDYRGQKVLLHMFGRDIAMTAVDLTTLTTTAAPVVIARSVHLGGRLVFPYPILDGYGELIGVSYQDKPTSLTAEQRLSLDLDPATPGLLLYVAPSYLEGGSYAGGRFFNGTVSQFMSIDAIWCTGGQAAIGNAMRVLFHTPPTPAPELYFSALMLGHAFLPVGQPIPGVNGLLGVDLAGMVLSSGVVHDNQTGTAMLPIPVPNNALLRGMQVPAQSVTLDGNRNRAWFGNTCWLSVDG